MPQPHSPHGTALHLLISSPVLTCCCSCCMGRNAQLLFGRCLPEPPAACLLLHTQVCPAIKGLALQLATALKPIYLRLEPKKDNQGNFTESPVPMYTFAIRCHNDLNKSIVDNQRFDSGLTSTVPAIRYFHISCDRAFAARSC